MIIFTLVTILDLKKLKFMLIRNSILDNTITKSRFVSMIQMLFCIASRTIPSEVNNISALTAAFHVLQALYSHYEDAFECTVPHYETL